MEKLDKNGKSRREFFKNLKDLGLKGAVGGAVLFLGSSNINAIEDFSAGYGRCGTGMDCSGGGGSCGTGMNCSGS